MKQQLNEIIIDILKENEKLVFIAIKQRAKFEGWLKFEIACRLFDSYCDVEVEYPYPNNKNRYADIYANGNLIELKTPNTNYNAEQCKSCTRPITKNISSIIEDINKLRNAGGNCEKYIAFVLFPIDSDGKYSEYIERIKNDGKVELIFKPLTINRTNVLVCSAEVF